MRFKAAGLLLILLTGFIFLYACGQREGKQTAVENKKFTIITSFYPIYIETLNVVKDIPEVRVINMTKPQTGCLHDYQLTPADLKTLGSASVFMINGAGMEAFMDKVVNQQPELKIIEASKGIRLLKNKNNGQDNPHVWVSVSDSILQVMNIGEQLALIDSENAVKYKKNTDVYIKKLEALKDKMHKVLNRKKNKEIITFHEAFLYFAKEFNLRIAAIIEREPGSEPNPKELADTIAVIKKSKIGALFAEPQYSIKAAEIIAIETGAKIYTLDPVVTGDGSLNSYIDIMEQNLKSLQVALK